MKVLIVGSGGREHAIAWKVAQSPKVDKIYCAPGNAGIAEYAECVDIAAMEFDKLVAFAKEKEIDLTVIGMDDPLVGGVVDAFEAEGLRVFGPRKNAGNPGRIESVLQRPDEKIPYPDGGIRDILRSGGGREVSGNRKIPDRTESRRSGAWKRRSDLQHLRGSKRGR